MRLLRGVTFMLISGFVVRSTALKYPYLCNDAVLDVTYASSTSSDIGHELLSGVYGDHSPQESMSGKLIHVMNGEHRTRTGCTADFHNAANSSAVWIAFIQRGECNFIDKIRNAIANHASAVVIYNQPGHNLTGISHEEHAVTTVQIGEEEATVLKKLLDEERELMVTVMRPGLGTRADLDPVTILVTAIMSSTAFFLNFSALIFIQCKKEKMKPHQFLVVNLILTDLFVSVLSAVQVALSYNSIHDECDDSESVMAAICAASVTTRLWNVFMYSNMFTLLVITMEHFFACRWPFLHKILLTRGKVLACISVCWIMSSMPDAIVFAMECDAQSLSGYTFCEYMHKVSSGNENWEVSAVLVSIITVTLATLIAVYGYILCLVHKLQIGNMEEKKKRTTIVTSVLFVFSFIISYAFFYYLHFAVAIERSATGTVIKELRSFWKSILPTGGLIADYELTGVVGAILDPIIYCARTKEVKDYVKKCCKKKSRSRSASSGTARAVRSASTDYTAVTAITEEYAL